MKRESGASVSAWLEGIKMPETGPLNENIECDVCVVGAGLAGMTTAYLLAKEGKSVVVLEAKVIGGGETGRTTAHLSNALDDRFYELIRLFGEEGALLAAQSHGRAIDKIEEIVKAEKIDCDFTRLDGFLFANDRKEHEDLLKELEAVQQIGWRDVVLRKECPVPTLTALGCLHFPNQGRFHVLKYLAALSSAFIGMGGRVFSQTKAVRFDTGPVVTTVVENNHAVASNSLVVATNTPANDIVTMHTKQAPYRTYVVGALVPKGSVPDALYWDMADPYHYVRLQKDNSVADASGTDLLIVGGEDHKTGQEDHPSKSFVELERWMRLKFPEAGEVVYRWSGQVYEPSDALAYIGRNPGDHDNVYIATGDSGHGMTHSTIAGMLITDLIMGRTNPWAKIYDPARSNTLKSAGEYLKENLNVAAQFKDYLTPGDVDDPMKVMPGTGSIIRRGATKVAVYCDQEGIRHECSAICTHMGCVVSWNNVESSWDCPCHGSRFDPFGRVITGPAIKDLGPSKQ